MSPDLSIMSTNLATMASALATMSSSLATMSSSLATTALTNATSTAPSIAQPEASILAPIKQTVYILSFVARNWRGALDTADGIRSEWQQEYSVHGTLDAYVSRDSAKKAGRLWLMDALKNRLKGMGYNDEERSDFADEWSVPETDENGIWKRGWKEPGDYSQRPRVLFESLDVILLGGVLETASDGVDGDDGKGKGKDKGE